MHPWQFLVALFISTPFVAYWMLTKTSCSKNIASLINKTKLAKFSNSILGETYNSFDSHKLPYYLCWGGFVELRQLSLVVCSVYAQNPIMRIFFYDCYMSNSSSSSSSFDC